MFWFGLREEIDDLKGEHNSLEARIEWQSRHIKQLECDHIEFEYFELDRRFDNRGSHIKKCTKCHKELRMFEIKEDMLKDKMKELNKQQKQIENDLFGRDNENN